MINRDRNRTKEPTRKGDTSRTSDRGRKVSSGGRVDVKKRGNPERDDQSNTPLKDMDRGDLEKIY